MPLMPSERRLRASPRVDRQGGQRQARRPFDGGSLGPSDGFGHPPAFASWAIERGGGKCSNAGAGTAFPSVDSSLRPLRNRGGFRYSKENDSTGALASKALPWITSSRVVRASKALCESSSTPYRSERLFSVIATNAAPVPAQGSRTLTGSSGNCKSFVSVGLRDCPTDSIQPISHLSIVELESVFAIKIRSIKRPWTSPVGGSAPIWPSSA